MNVGFYLSYDMTNHVSLNPRLRELSSEVLAQQCRSNFLSLKAANNINFGMCFCDLIISRLRQNLRLFCSVDIT